jgi:hypothetical protein
VIAGYLAHAYRGGGILADDASATPLMFDSGLNLSEFVTIGFHPYYDNALIAPAANVAWVIAHDGDAVAGDIRKHPDRFTRFKPVMTDGYFILYRRQ